MYVPLQFLHDINPFETVVRHILGLSMEKSLNREKGRKVLDKVFRHNGQQVVNHSF
jgi:hypothetical protein